MKTYGMAEMFYSLQGEGLNAGRPAVFIRFAGCNLTCTLNDYGFDCDTDFSLRNRMTADDIEAAAQDLAGQIGLVIFTGGEPLLQLDEDLLETFASCGWETAIETNGTQEIGPHRYAYIDHVVCSPKGEQAIEYWMVDEWKVVVMANTKTLLEPPVGSLATKVASPRFCADGQIDDGALQVAIDLVMRGKDWQLSVQQHKGWGVP
jgi:7-carboxy-7-deazaguanine synthase